MGFLEGLALLFTRTFGITEPTASQKRRAAWYITALLVLVLALICAAGGIVWLATTKR